MKSALEVALEIFTQEARFTDFVYCLLGSISVGTGLIAIRARNAVKGKTRNS